MLKHVLIVATLDTKGAEGNYVANALRSFGVQCRLVDASTSAIDADRHTATQTAITAVAATIAAEQAEGTLLGVLALGGSVGTQIAASAMQEMPFGVPKLIVSTMASGQVRPYVQGKDIIMMNAVADISGLNRITRAILAQAAAAMAGMCANPKPAEPLCRPLVVASMFGITTPCVQHARRLLEGAGYEVVVFSANGVGGSSMEALIEQGGVAGVLDVTTTEVADEVAGGTLSAGPHRLNAAIAAAVPQVVSVGAVDVVNFGTADTIPLRVSERLFHKHSDNVTLMRSSFTENTCIGQFIGCKLKNNAHTTMLLPSLGVSALDRAGAPFDDPQTRQELFRSLQAHIGSTKVTMVNHHINDLAFAEYAATELLRLMNARTR